MSLPPILHKSAAREIRPLRFMRPLHGRCGSRTLAQQSGRPYRLAFYTPDRLALASACGLGDPGSVADRYRSSRGPFSASSDQKQRRPWRSMLWSIRGSPIDPRASRPPMGNEAHHSRARDLVQHGQAVCSRWGHRAGAGAARRTRSRRCVLRARGGAAQRWSPRATRSNGFVIASTMSIIDW